MNSEYKSALFLSIKIGYLSSFQKQAANSLVTETLQYFVFFCRPAYSAILVKCLIINVLRFILAIPFFTAFLNITYTARHTFATTTTLSKGVPIETVSKMLGHTNIETTQIYARITNSKIGSDMQGLDKKFVGIEKIYKEVAM
ncbi:tyrosine-type recombinase/integrase [Bacteroides caccae]|uniref:tyrosine-type recombinase/integrase n=1 Tax=Bacteroides caccae TaxID=47678 RepID=UPI00356A6739